jgi:cellulase
MPSLKYAAASVVAGATLASAHGFVNKVIINGETLPAYDVTSLPYQSNPAAVIGWSTSATDTGFVDGSGYSTGDIICHRDGGNAQISATVAAGDTVSLVWNTWPESHHGPVIDYLANCGESCETVDKSTLEFFKIDEAGLVDGSSAPGVWASDDLIANGLTWTTTIPANIAAGNYVLRHEIIALHSAGDPNGAQNYPQCINLKVTGSGTEAPAGVLGTSLYTPTDEGILFNIYQPMDSYPIPGPPLASGLGGGSSPEPVPSSEPSAAPTATPTATGSATAVPTTAAPTGASSTAAAPTETSPAESSPSAAYPTTAVPAPSATSATDAATSEPAAAPTGGARPPCSRRRRRHARDVESHKRSLRH